MPESQEIKAKSYEELVIYRLDKVEGKLSEIDDKLDSTKENSAVSQNDIESLKKSRDRLIYAMSSTAVAVIALMIGEILRLIANGA